MTSCASGASCGETCAHFVGRDRARWIGEGGLGDRDGDLTQPLLNVGIAEKIVLFDQEAKSVADNITLAGVLP